MKQKTKIIIFTTISIPILAALGILIFVKGSLVINSNVPIKTIQVDGKNYPVPSNKNVLLPIGPHQIVVNQDFYEETETSVSILPWSKRGIAITLNLNSDGRQIINNAKIVTNYSAIFTSNNDSGEYLASIREYVNEDTFQNILFEINDSLASQSTTTPTSLPKIFLPIGSAYIEKTSDGAIATIGVSKTSDDLSLSNLQYNFSKVNNSWIITNIIYNQ